MRESITKRTLSFVGPTLEVPPPKKKIFYVGSCSLNQLHVCYAEYATGNESVGKGLMG